MPFKTIEKTASPGLRRKKEKLSDLGAIQCVLGRAPGAFAPEPPSWWDGTAQLR